MHEWLDFFFKYSVSSFGRELNLKFILNSFQSSSYWISNIGRSMKVYFWKTCYSRAASLHKVNIWHCFDSLWPPLNWQLRQSINDLVCGRMCTLMWKGFTEVHAVHANRRRSTLFSIYHLLPVISFDSLDRIDV